MLAFFSVVLQIVETAMQRGDGRPDRRLLPANSVDRQANGPIDFYWQVVVL
ncbi:hypothetical protein [Rhizobium etli]|uniref:hypothetical protein n=1 Tax=Rhizobium etli TaxID=29449 RepID=UPI000ABB4C72|nr:hypothetical protein [Rhizobium sp. IE4771]